MTVVYTDKIASRGGFGSFWKLLARWRGSVYKVVWQDMLAYLIFYYFINFIYRFALDETHQRNFEQLVIHIARFRGFIPLSLVLGFYVSLVVSRWWGVYQCIPWPDKAAIIVATHLPGQSPEVKEARRDILRYINLTIALTFKMVSPPVARKLTSLNAFVSAGYLTEEEKGILDDLDAKSKQHKTWVPVLWACERAEQARKDGHLSDLGQRVIMSEMLELRGCCGSLMGWNTYNVPLVYTQVVTLAVYSFFFFSLIGEQFLDPAKKHEGHNIDLYVPFFAFLQLFFYISWLKVAEALLNPFGADDHDFEFVPMLTRHLEMTALLSELSLNHIPKKAPQAHEESTKLQYIDDTAHCDVGEYDPLTL
ncbi:bestrophin-3-like [Eriocheir sinensis]|uniref:bestrophin-3-like n=1 Tax=Eriocheir sinensis TaxID=95602 RepID=UPI0021C735E0|nr:bestrophin-3-like [Eriocheir sinensis]